MMDVNGVESAGNVEEHLQRFLSFRCAVQVVEDEGSCFTDALGTLFHQDFCFSEFFVVRDFLV
jgi:hypothetical protein